MFREMRRTDSKLTEQETVQILYDNQYGVPISYVYVVGKIYHGANADGLKKENIEHNSKACFTVVGKTEILPFKFSTKYESIIAFGQIKVSQDRQGILRKILPKYSPEYLKMEKNIFLPL